MKFSAGCVGVPIVFQRYCRDLAQIHIVPYHARVAGIGPLDLKVPLAALVIGVELYVDTVAVGQDAVRRQFVIRPVIVAWVIETEKFDAVPGTINDRHVALIFSK